jgi:hypothetical protein
MISTASNVQYFGLEVTVIARLETCALIRFQGRDLIVETADLTASQSCLLAPDSAVPADTFTEASAPPRQMAACSQMTLMHST